MGGPQSRKSVAGWDLRDDPEKIWHAIKSKDECQAMDAVRILRNEIGWM